jgi:hypothetical protein
MLKEQLEAAENSLGAPAQEFDGMGRAKKPVLVNQAQYFDVPFRQLEIPKVGTALKSPGSLSSLHDHHSILSRPSSD